MVTDKIGFDFLNFKKQENENLFKRDNNAPPKQENTLNLRFNQSILDQQNGYRAFQLNLKFDNLPAPTTVAAKKAPSEPIDNEKIKFLRDTILDGEGLVAALSSPRFNEKLKPNHSEKIKLIGEIVRGDGRRAESLLLDTGFGVDVRNKTYDRQKVIAQSVGAAYQAGEISDADLKNFAQKLGAEKTNELVLTLNSSPANARSGGVLESLGRQAKSLGYQQSAALAFTSSEELIKNNLPTGADRKTAFQWVKHFVEDSPIKEHPYQEDITAQYRSQFTFAVANAARLTASGDGYIRRGDTGEWDKLVKQLGPRMLSEVISRATVTGGDAKAGGALDLLGATSRRMIAGANKIDKPRWEVNQYTAFTQSPQLIGKNLTTAGERLRAFDVLNKDLVRTRGDVKDALKRGYSLLHQPAATHGLTTLLETNGKQILDGKIGTDGTNYKGQADVVQFLQSTLYSPLTSANDTNRIRGVMQNYVKASFNAGRDGNARSGERIGALLGLHDVAFKRAFETASTPEEKTKMQEIQEAVVKTVITKAGEALLAETGPIGAEVGGFVLGQVLDEVFKDKTPKPSELGAAFVKLLQDGGREINDATKYKDNLIAAIDKIRDGMKKVLESGKLNQERTDKLQNAVETLGTVEEKFRARTQETITDYDNPNGVIRQALNDWKTD